MKRARNAFRPYQVWFVMEGGGPVVRDRAAWADPDHALDYGIDIAQTEYAGLSVEVIVIRTMDRHAVRNRLVSAHA